MTEIEHRNRFADRLPQVGALLIAGGLILAMSVPLTALGKAQKVIMCHAAGQEGTDQYVTLELSEQAVYGNSGHLNEDGTPQAGHEGDHLGPCVEESSTTTAGKTGSDSDTSTTTPTTVPQMTPTTETEAIPAIEDAPSTTTTTSPEAAAVSQPTTTTTATEQGAEPSVGAAGTANTGGPQIPTIAAGRKSAAAPAATLPFTGVEDSLIFPASVLLLAGSFLVFATGGSSGSHVSTASMRFGLGLHRGRHESRDR